MSSQPRIEIQGQAPFNQSGVYEAQISLVEIKPSDDDIRTKKFTPLWRGNFHLKVKDGVFSEKLGDSNNPLPKSVSDLDTVYVIVNDLFSSVYSIFDVTLRKTSEIAESQEKPAEKPVERPSKPKRSTKNISTSDNNSPRGIRGPTGDKG